MPTFGPPEPVLIENDWYDGPRAGIASIGGQPHRFLSEFDPDEDDWLGVYLVWPVSEAELALEREQWQIFVRWNEAYEAGRVGTETHPGHGGIDARRDELEALLNPLREPPSTAKRARARMEYLDRDERYAADGPDYLMAWAFV